MRPHKKRTCPYGRLDITAGVRTERAYKKLWRLIMASGQCPFYEFRGWSSYTGCKASGRDIPGDVGKNLCDSSAHEDCPVYKGVVGK
jgi:hypothetical protein